MTVENHKPVVIMAGGTGGHVFPALAVADVLRSRGQNVVWVGTRAGLESRLVPQAGYALEWLSIKGVRGKGMLARLLAPFTILQACWQALLILRRLEPRAVLGMGGFVAGPAGLMAWLMSRPLIIHEQNAVIGLTNRLLSRLARRCYFAFPQAASGVHNSYVVGNPVRADIVALPAPEQRLADRQAQALRVLVIGGSLGAQALNETVPRAMALIKPEHRAELRHQCGAGKLEDCRAQYQRLSVAAELVEFIDDMAAAYAWADLVLCRAGALTVSELSAAGVASIMVPYPHHVDDQQYHNACYLADQGAAIVVRQHDFSAEFLSAHLIEFSANRQLLIDMAVKARQLAHVDAAERVADGILEEALA